MKGIVLAGGSGTRLYPITKGISNQHVDFSQFDRENIAKKYIEDYEAVMRKG